MSLSGYRLAPEHITVIALDTDYAIENFPRQNDQPPGRDWIRPGDYSDVIEATAEVVIALSGGAYGYGEAGFAWKLQGLTPLMVKYILDTYFNSEDMTALATARTFNRASGAFEVYQCTINRQRYVDGAEIALGGYDKFQIDFIKPVLIT